MTSGVIILALFTIISLRCVHYGRRVRSSLGFGRFKFVQFSFDYRENICFCFRFRFFSPRFLLFFINAFAAFSGRLPCCQMSF